MLDRLFSKKFVDESYLIHDNNLIDKLIQDEEYPYLVSFPRTGSHWIRNVMELYLEKPSLTRVFFYPAPTSFSCYHTHDQNLQVTNRKNVIYLYRDPVPTVFSQLKYYKEDPADDGLIGKWAQQYARHLKKWLKDETYTSQKTIVRYESFKADFHREFAKICDHFDVPLNAKKLDTALKMVSKQSIMKKVSDDTQVVNLDKDYETKRDDFTKNKELLIMDIIRDCDPDLMQWVNKVG